MQPLPAMVAVVVLSGLGLGVWLASGDGRGSVGRAQPPVRTVARTRALAPSSACLLTDAGGVTHSPAAAVWTGVQAAAAGVEGRATFLPVPTVKLADPMVNSLIAQHCTVVIGVGPEQDAAVQRVAAAGKHPGIGFAVAGAPATPHVVGFAATSDAAAMQVGKLLQAGRNAS